MLVLLLLLVVEGRGEGGKDSTSLLANVGCDGREEMYKFNPKICTWYLALLQFIHSDVRKEVDLIFDTILYSSVL